MISDTYIFEIGDELIEINDALKGDISGVSQKVGDYELALKNFFNAKYCLAVSSGTAALQAAMYAIGIRGPDDEVLLTPTCPLCTVFPAIFSGAKIIFCDTNEDNFGINILDAKKICNQSIRAIIDIPMWGYPTQVDKLYSFARSNNIPLVLDVAHCHGTMLHNRHLSEYCDIACFSTQNSKVLSTGEGGFLLTGNMEYFKKAKNFINFGGLTGRDFGLNFKLGALQASVGLTRLRTLLNNLKQRRRNASYIINKISGTSVREIAVPDGGEPNYYRLLLKTQGPVAPLLSHLIEHGVPSDIVKYGCKPLYYHQLLKRYRRECVNAERLLQCVTTVPVHPGLTHYDLDSIASAIQTFS